jgi:hypothetical protein
MDGIEFKENLVGGGVHTEEWHGDLIESVYFFNKELG